MNLLLKLKNSLNLSSYSDSESAYQKWADHYDDEKDNLMLFYDNIILKELLVGTELADKHILDYGCGTGRNFRELSIHKPAKITGCDNSPEMLRKLNENFPGADTYLIKNNSLDFLRDNSIDIIISTLVIAHIIDIENIFSQWNRVLKEKSEIIITDFHPILLNSGGERTFRHKGEIIKIRNYVHNISFIINILNKYNFNTIGLIEKQIAPDVKHFYENKNALHVYERFYGIPFIYGLHLSR